MMLIVWLSTIGLLLTIYLSNSGESVFQSSLFVVIPISIITSSLSRKYHNDKIKSMIVFYDYIELNKKLENVNKNLEDEVDKKTKNLQNINVELQKSQSQLKVKKDRFEALINKLQQAVIYLDTKGNILELNKSLLTMIDSPSTEASKSINILEYDPLIENGYTTNYIECIDSKMITFGENKYKSKWGRELFVKYYFVPIFENDEIVGALSSIEDFTERKQMEDELVEAKDKAEENNRLKSAFLANMSHEIRTPLNGILGFANLILKRDVTKDELDKYLTIIVKSGNRLNNTINDIIEISKLESNQVKLLPSKINVNDLLINLYDFFEHQCLEKHIELIMDYKIRDEEIIIETDQVKLNSIITNLLNNALKYTKDGFIEIGINTNKTHIEFYVKDSGIGIPKDRHDAIFERFVQADIEDKEAFEGSGLGLTISKSYVEMLGGKIWVESKVGLGSTFTFSIPK